MRFAWFFTANLVRGATGKLEVTIYLEKVEIFKYVQIGVDFSEMETKYTVESNKRRSYDGPFVFQRMLEAEGPPRESSAPSWIYAVSAISRMFE